MFWQTKQWMHTGSRPGGPPARRIVRVGASSKESDVAGLLRSETVGKNRGARESGRKGASEERAPGAERGVSATTN